MSEPKKPNLKKLDVKRVRLSMLGLLVVVGVVVGAIALLGGGSDDGSSESSESAKNAVALTESELLARASSLGGPVYWIGPRAGTASYELSTMPDGQVYIRYLTGDAKAGDPRPDFLTIGTYSVPKARQALQSAVKSAEGNQKLSQHEGYVALSSDEATNAYVVFDDQPELQVEIYSPQAGEAAELAASGSLKPLG